MKFITAIRSGTTAGHEGITHVRWLDSSTERAKTYTTASVAKWLEQSGSNVVKVAGEDSSSFVAVRERNGHKYLQTHANKQWNDNLLSLPLF